MPDTMPSEAEIKALTYPVVEKNKGSGYAGRLIELCDFAEFPQSIVGFLTEIYALFPKPAPIPPIEEPPEGAELIQPPASPAGLTG